MTTTLLVDVGNSRLKWTLLQGGARGVLHSEPYSPGRVPDLLGKAWPANPVPGRILIASVASGEINGELRRWIEATWKISPDFIQSEAQYLGVTNGYRQPERLGVDRWLALIAAYHHCRGPVGIVDAGTAVTIDLVDRLGIHQGGWILPGLALYPRCLRANTAIPDFGELAPTLTFGAGTAEAIANGGLAAVAGAIETAARIASTQETLRGIRWVLTGGDADRLASMISLDFEIIGELVMDGLNRIAELLVAKQ